MNVGLMKAEIREKLGLAVDDAVLPADVIVRAINAAAKAISTEQLWPWLYTEVSGNLTAGSPDLTTPATLTRTEFLSVNGAVLQLRARADLLNFASEVGVPSYYRVGAGKFIVVPKPATGVVYPYVLGYYQVEPALVADANEPLLPDAYSDWLVTEAAIKVAIRTNNLERLATLKEEAKEWRRRTLDDVRRSLGSPQIRRLRPSVWQEV